MREMNWCVYHQAWHPGGPCNAVLAGLGEGTYMISAAEQKVKELEARVEALERRAVTGVAPPEIAGECPLCRNTGWYAIDKGRCPRGCPVGSTDGK